MLIPVHGEYQHLKAHAELAQQMGIPKENTIILSSGDVLDLCEDHAVLIGKVQAQGIMVDGLGVGDVGNIVLRDRQYLSENGLIIIVLTLEKYTNQLSCRTGYCITRLCLCQRIGVFDG